jgi:hypothetical protein
MGFFTRTKLPPAQTETDLLAEIEQAYQAAKAEHIAASEAVNEPADALYPAAVPCPK